MVTKNWERPEKGKARRFMMASEGASHHKKTAKFFMPAKKCYDIKEGLKNKTLKRQDYIVAVDNNPKVCKSIDIFLSKNFDNYQVICSNVQEVNLIEVLEGKKIDFIFLDLCGRLKADLCNWLYQYRNCFTDTCQFGLTVIAFNRASKFEPIIHDEIKGTEYLEQLESLLEDSRNNLTRSIVGKKIKIGDKRQEVKKAQAVMAVNVIKSIKASCYSFLITMNNKDISINRLYRYKDKKHSEMVFIDFRFNGKKTGDNFITKLIKKYDDNVNPVSQVFKSVKVKKAKKGITPVIDNVYTIMAKLREKAEIELPLTAGKKAAISRWAKKAGKDPMRMQRKIVNILSKSV